MNYSLEDEEFYKEVLEVLRLVGIPEEDVEEVEKSVIDFFTFKLKDGTTRRFSPIQIDILRLAESRRDKE